MPAFAFDLSLLQGFDWALSVVLIASVLSLIGVCGGRLFRSLAHRHFWLLTCMLTILWLPIAVVVLPRWFYPDFRVPLLPDLVNLTSLSDAVAYPSQATDAANELGFAEVMSICLLLGCGLWGMGVVISISRVMFAWGKLKNIRLQGTIYRLPKRTAAFLKRKYSVKRLPEVVLTGKIQNAVAVGIFRPQIMVHRQLVHELSSRQLCDVLDHEMAHVVRRDCLVMFLEQVTLACHWCNPLALWLCHELARSREQMCDNTVLTRRPAFAYGETLLRVAELTFQSSAGRRVLAMLSRLSDLRWRMQAILNPSESRTMSVSHRAAVAMIVGIALCGWLIGGVSFTPDHREENITLWSQFNANVLEADR